MRFHSYMAAAALGASLLLMPAMPAFAAEQAPAAASQAAEAALPYTYTSQQYGYTMVFAYIALCWALVAILVTVFGPKTRARALA